MRRKLRVYLHIQCSVLLHSFLEELCFVFQVLQILFVFLNHVFLLLLQVCNRSTCDCSGVL